MTNEEPLFFKTEKEKRLAFIKEYSERFSWLKEKMLRRYGLEDEDLLLVNFAAAYTDDDDDNEEDEIEIAKAFYCVALDKEELRDMFYEMELMYTKHVENNGSFEIGDIGLN
jgi:hypothetical protein